MSKYFSKLPIIEYGNTYARNITARVGFTDKTRSNYNLFYPYTMKDDEKRADILSHKYYDDADYAWLIYMTNDVVDPYYDLGLTDELFRKFIIKKYGSLEESQRKIQFFRNDWSVDESVLNPEQFNSLDINRKKYYTAILDYAGRVSGYERKKADWISSTNKIQQLNITANTAFTVGSAITQGAANAVITFANTSVVSIKHVFGNFSNGSVSSSNTTATITNVITISESIPDDEIAFWSTVSAFEYEQEENQKKRAIHLVDNRYVSMIEDEIKDLLDE